MMMAWAAAVQQVAGVEEQQQCDAAKQQCGWQQERADCPFDPSMVLQVCVFHASRLMSDV